MRALRRCKRTAASVAARCSFCFQLPSHRSLAGPPLRSGPAPLRIRTCSYSAAPKDKERIACVKPDHRLVRVPQSAFPSDTRIRRGRAVPSRLRFQCLPPPQHVNSRWSPRLAARSVHDSRVARRTRRNRRGIRVQILTHPSNPASQATTPARSLHGRPRPRTLCVAADTVTERRGLARCVQRFAELRGTYRPTSLQLPSIAPNRGAIRAFSR